MQHSVNKLLLKVCRIYHVNVDGYVVVVLSNLKLQFVHCIVTQTFNAP